MFDSITVFGKSVLVREFKGRTYVAAKQLVEALSLPWPTQAAAMRRRLERVRCLHFKDAHGKRKWMLAIPAVDVNEWASAVTATSNSDSDLLLTAFMDMLEDEAFEESAEMVLNARTVSLGDKYANLPLTSPELKLIYTDRRSYGTPLDGFMTFLGYRRIAASAKRELEWTLTKQRLGEIEALAA
ncbi:hypothetical protein [Rhizobium sp. R86522]|uniref:hypothetical protein n=1 Tax=Rhizobium sp. R86522 TaxID=3093861 RepID=UPI00366FF4A7